MVACLAVCGGPDLPLPCFINPNFGAVALLFEKGSTFMPALLISYPLRLLVLALTIRAEAQRAIIISSFIGVF